ADDQIDVAIRQRDLLDIPFQELDVVEAGLPLVLPRELHHFIRDVEPVHLAMRTDPASSQKHVDPAAAPQIKDDLARSGLGQGYGVGTAKGRRDSLRRQVLQVLCSIGTLDTSL